MLCRKERRLMALWPSCRVWRAGSIFRVPRLIRCLFGNITGPTVDWLLREAWAAKTPEELTAAPWPEAGGGRDSRLPNQHPDMVTAPDDCRPSLCVDARRRYRAELCSVLRDTGEPGLSPEPASNMWPTVWEAFGKRSIRTPTSSISRSWKTSGSRALPTTFAMPLPFSDGADQCDDPRFGSSLPVSPRQTSDWCSNVRP